MQAARTQRVASSVRAGVSGASATVARVATDKRLRRLLALGQALIDARRGISLERYAQQHGYSRSTIYRDADVLRDIGFPIKSEHGLHRVDAAFQLFGRRGLDPDELLALFVARQLAGRLPGSRLDRALASLWAKASGDGDQPALLPRDDSTLSVAAFDTIDFEPHRQTIDTLDQAIHQRVTVRLSYRKASTGEVSHRDVEPGALHADARSGGLFLIAWCRWRRAVRVFAIQRVLSVAATGERFTPRPATRSKEALKHAFGVWVGTHADAPVLVRIRFARGVAEEIAERRWHASQEVRRIGGGEIELSMRLGDPAGVIRWVMGYGEDAVVESPAWLGEEVRQRHQQAGAVVLAGASGAGGTRRSAGAPGRAGAGAAKAVTASRRRAG